MSLSTIIGFDVQTILLCATAFLILSWWLRGPKNLPPGPWGWPVVGYVPNLLISLYRSRLHPHQLLTNLASKHGRVFSMYIGSKLVVVLNKYDCIREAFQNPLLNDRPHSRTLDELGISAGLVQASGEAWKQQRRFTLTTLRSFGVGKKSFQEQIAEEAKALTKEIALLKEKSFDPRYLFTNATANIICSVVFGNRFEYSDPGFKYFLDIINQNVQLFGAGAVQMFFPITKYLQPSSYRLLKKNILNLSEFITGIVKKHVALHDQDNPGDYIDVYLNEIKLNNKLSRDTHVNGENLTFTVAGLFGAGTETTSTTLRWAVMYMMTYPEIQGRIQKEMDAVVGRNRLPRLADKEELHFTSATLLEIQRITTIAPLGLIHCSGEDTTLEGYTIPKGSIIVANLWAVHHDPELWKDPHKFNPGRFLDKEGHLQHREELIPFSTGRRICVGEHLAKMEVYIFFTHLLHQFTFKKPDDSPPLSFKGIVGLANSTGPFLTQVTKRD